MFPNFSIDPKSWRFRTLFPVLLIHTVAFVGLYLVVWTLVEGEIVAVFRQQAEQLLAEVEPSCSRFPGPSLDPLRFEELSRQHGDAWILRYDGSGALVGSSSGAFPDQAAAGLALASPSRAAIWSQPGPDVYLISRRLDEGVLQVGQDLRGPLRAARRRVRIGTALIVAAWAGLAMGTGRIRELVIGRPLARIEKAAAVAGAGSSKGNLDHLADRLDGAIWELLEGQKRRESELTTHMARAEQLATLGELAAGLTHEIRSPLAGVTAALEVLRDDVAASDPSSAQLFDQMRGEIGRVMATVDGLLRLAKPEPARRIPTDLDRLVRQVVSLFEPRARKKSVKVLVATTEALPSLSLDPNLVTQLLLNLLTNSLQAMPAKGRIDVLLAPFPRRDGAILTVVDDGPGIPAEKAGRVFEPFFTTKEEGTGLGLPICRSIVEQHGGTITLESEPGKGTRILILLPAAEGRNPIAA